MVRARLAGCVLVLFSLFSVRGAVADEERGPWYGWQIILVDAAAGALIFAPVADRWGPSARGIGMTALFMGAPIAHMANRNARSASWTLLRVPAVVLGQIAGNLIARPACRTLSCVDAAPTIGSSVLIAPVIALDLLTAFAPRSWSW